MGGLGTLLLLGLIAWFFWRRQGENVDLDAILADAERAGIITEDQRQAILERSERTAGSGSARISGVTWLAIAAGLFVLAGISLLIATNWESIGPEVRIGAFLVLLLAIGESAIRTRARLVGVALELVWLAFPLLGIGLYAQTFQLSGEAITPFLVWLALTAPLAWMSRHEVVPSAHTAALAGALLLGSFVSEGPMLIRDVTTPTAWGLSIATLALVVAQSARLLPEGQRYHVLGIAAAWLLGVLAVTPPFGLENAAWIIVACFALTTLWMVGLVRFSASTSEKLTGATAWIGLLYALTFAWHSDGAFDGDATTSGVVATVVLSITAFVGAGTAPVSGSSRTILVSRALLAAPLALSFAVLGGPGGVHVAAVLANFVLVAIAVALMWHGSIERDPGEINFGILTLLVVLVTRFLDVFGTFLQSGLGFIVAGLLLAALAYALERTRRRLLVAPEDASR